MAATTPKIKWGASLANTWQFPSAVDKPLPDPRQKLGVAESDSGYRDTWAGVTLSKLSFEVRFVPSANQGSVTGYSTETTGVQNALLYLMANGGRFFPDGTNEANYHDVYLEEYSVDRDGAGPYYRIKMVLRDAGGNLFLDY